MYKNVIYDKCTRKSAGKAMRLSDEIDIEAAALSVRLPVNVLSVRAREHAEILLRTRTEAMNRIVLLCPVFQMNIPRELWRVPSEADRRLANKA